jgi:hypothetical protein
MRMAFGERATVVMASGMRCMHDARGGSCMAPGGRGIARDSREGAATA